METGTSEQERVSSRSHMIDSVGTIDLRRATEASIGGITHISNVGLILYSSETAGMLARIKIDNTGTLLEAPADAKVVTGNTTFSRAYFADQVEPLRLIVMGQLLIQPDLQVEELDRGLDGLFLIGQAICPEHLMGILQAKMRQAMGEVVAYPASARLISGQLVLDESRLRGLADGSNLFITDSLLLPDVLPDDLLAQKIGTLAVRGHIRCHEENAPTLMARLSGQPPKVVVIPAGFVLLDRSVALDDTMLSGLPGPRIYCTGRVQIDPQITPALLETRLEALISESQVLCPAALREAIVPRCNPVTNRLVLYEGELWLIENEYRLLPSRFDYLRGQATLLVEGELTVDPAVEPQVLAERLAKVHNYGEIICTPAQMAAIQARLGTNEGGFVDSTADKQHDEQQGIDNVGYLAL
jgi:hypothetical protein